MVFLLQISHQSHQLGFDYTKSGSLDSHVVRSPLRLKFGTTVQLVLQDTNIFVTENHPIHLHGYSFFILAEGFGNFNHGTDPAKFNFVDPPHRNTVGVPVGGWAIIRFVADNPGTWLMHCDSNNHSWLSKKLSGKFSTGVICKSSKVSLKVFMYDMPPEFHFALLDWKAQGDCVA
ncbi:hypothetical protein IFM89_016284 [Coptis chinensis]|uniref:Plastocyanin-like domain-containing protein n=1 Tax=Coptis chinensis TaxID=261450 RepID=A0A835HMK7_9MAGN|nr:hypothetical protein IFM89_016284 [Coptis chinensis]